MHSRLHPVRAVTATLHTCSRTLSSTPCVLAPNIYVRWDTKADVAVFNEDKIRRVFAFQGFDTRVIIPLNNVKHEGVNSALVEIRESEIERCLRDTKFSGSITVAKYKPPPPKPIKGNPAPLTLAIYGVPVGSDGQGIQDVDHTQRQLARRILQETNIALVNAKTIKESVTSDNTLTVHVRVKEEQDVDRLLKWKSEGYSVGPVSRSKKLAPDVFKAKLFSDREMPLHPRPSPPSLTWQPGRVPSVVAVSLTEAEAESEIKPSSAPSVEEELARLPASIRRHIRTTGPLRNVGLGRRLKVPLRLMGALQAANKAEDADDLTAVDEGPGEGVEAAEEVWDIEASGSDPSSYGEQGQEYLMVEEEMDPDEPFERARLKSDEGEWSGQLMEPDGSEILVKTAEGSGRKGDVEGEMRDILADEEGDVIKAERTSSTEGQLPVNGGSDSGSCRGVN